MSPEARRKIAESARRTHDYYRQALAYWRTGNYAAAEVECRRALELSPRIGGKIINTEAARLLGEIHLSQGRNREAVDIFLQVQPNSRPVPPDLGLALAYCRLGKYTLAKQCYSDKLVLRHMRIVTAQDLPETANLRALEASILYARGVEAAINRQYEDVTREYAPALKLAPTNAAIAFYYGYALRALKRYQESDSLFAIAATYGNPKIRKDAEERLRAIPKARRDQLMRNAQALRRG